ncbi:O-antigen ligase family protein [Luteibaculum oceani]|uniref:O-antigen ligase family protein n=1 Tax=Luteibaculum oceani TaxID=1294296 RepID=A0A5C6UUR4_9FLAO|nr:O-antigen ligase family protein [Luteibaculum oceani]TXC77123.1 O-antigen ligase family protein [Luteibaculum oceani]
MSATDSTFKRLVLMLGALILALIVSLCITKFGVTPAVALMAIPIGLIYVYWVVQKPMIGVYSTLIIAFFCLGLARYKDGTWGLLIDGTVALTLVATLLNTRIDKSLSKLSNVGFATTAIWFIATFLELFNPIAPTMAAWFYAVRGVSLYAILFLPACLWLLQDEKNIKGIIAAWLILATLGALWGIKQKYIGLDWAETAWINGPNGKTHMLRGKLRVFSFFSDSGQYSAVMCHASLVAFILFTGPFSKQKKAIFLAIALVTFYGLVISGTRGAFAVAAGGGLLYLLIIRNFRLFAAGLSGMILFFCFLKFTSIGSGIYDIQRMRTALDPNNPSLQVRIENQKLLAAYLVDKPFGKGIGSGGSWAKRFAPNSFLADVPLDSWYVKIWVETGVVGLALHIFLILVVTFYGARRVYLMDPSPYRTILNAMVSGYFGIAVASYGNQIYGQAPTGIIIIISIAILSTDITKNKEIAIRNNH